MPNALSRCSTGWTIGHNRVFSVSLEEQLRHASTRNGDQVKQLILLSLLLAVASAVARAVYCVWIIVSNGATEWLTEVALPQLLLEVMKLHWYGLGGAVAGAIVGVVAFALGMRRASVRASVVRDPHEAATFRRDTNAIIKSEERQRAERYLAQRRQDSRNG